MKWLKPVLTYSTVAVIAAAAALVLQRNLSLTAPADDAIVASARTLEPDLAPGSPETTVVTPAHAKLLQRINSQVDDARELAIEAAVASISSGDRRSLLAALAEDNSEAAAELRDAAVRNWAESDPAAAAAWLATLPDGPAYRAALKQIATAWAHSDLPKATAWLKTLPPEARELAAMDVAYEAAAAEPIAAMRIASPLPASRERDELLVFTASQWAVTDAATASAWAQKIPDAQLRLRLLGAVAVAMSAKNPAGAAALTGSAIPPGADQDRVAVSVVQRWAQTAPQAAAEWVLRFPESSVRYAAAQNLATVWALKDAAAADQWLNSLPAGRTRDAAAAGYTQSLASLNSVTSESTAMP